MVCGTTSYCQVWPRNTTRQCAHGADRRHRVGESSRECKKNETRSRSAWLAAPERVAALSPRRHAVHGLQGGGLA